MTSVEIRTLLQPPSAHEADSRALAHLNATYHSLDDLENGADLDELVEQARKELDDLDAKVRAACISRMKGSDRSSHQLSSCTLSPRSTLL